MREEAEEKEEPKFDLAVLQETEENRDEVEKDKFMSFMEVVWPTVANYYFQVEREISDTIEKASPIKGTQFRDSRKLFDNSSKLSGGDDYKNEEKHNSDKLSEDSSHSLQLEKCNTYDCSLNKKSSKTRIQNGSNLKTGLESSKKIVQIQDTAGSITWDVIETKSTSPSYSTHNDNNKHLQIHDSTPIIVHHDPLMSDSSIPPNIRQALINADHQIRQALSTCFGRVSKSFTSSYPRIRFILNKSYPQIRHTVSCSYPNIQYTINNSYDKVQATVKSSYPKIRKTVTNVSLKRQIISSCYRKFRKMYPKTLTTSKGGGGSQFENGPLAKSLVDANFDVCTRLSGANAEISQALHHASKRVSSTLGTANLEVLQSLKHASHKVSKALVKANSEVLEALAMANDDLQKSLGQAQAEAHRTIDGIKKELSTTLFDLHPKVLRKILFGFDDLMKEMENAHLKMLETLAKASQEVCEQISLAHSKYSEAKINVNYELSLNLAKSNSQILQVLISSNLKVSDVFEKNNEKVQQITSNFKLGQSSEGLEQKVWKCIENGEVEILKSLETANFTVESAVEHRDGKLWQIADDSDNTLRKTCEAISKTLSNAIASVEWKLKNCAEKLENQVITDTVNHLKEIAWNAVGNYVTENLSQCFGKHIQEFYKNNKQGGDYRPDFQMRLPQIESKGSVQILVCYNNEYYVGFPESEEEEGNSMNEILSLESSELNQSKENPICPSNKVENIDHPQSTLAPCSANLNLTNAETDEIIDKEQKSSMKQQDDMDIENKRSKIDTLNILQQVSKMVTKIKCLHKTVEETREKIHSLEQYRISTEQLERFEKKSAAILSRNHHSVRDSKSKIKCKIDKPEVKEQDTPIKLIKTQDSGDSIRHDNDLQSEIEPQDKKQVNVGDCQLDTNTNNFEPKNESKEEKKSIETIISRPTTTTLQRSNSPFDLLTDLQISSPTPPSIQELSACFRTNLQKIQETIKSTKCLKQVNSSETFPLNPTDSFTVLETQQLIEECHQAWNIITSMYNTSNISFQDQFPNNKVETESLTTENVCPMQLDFNNNLIPCPIEAEVLNKVLEISNCTVNDMSENDSVFAYIGWETVSATGDDMTSCPATAFESRDTYDDDDDKSSTKNSDHLDTLSMECEEEFQEEEENDQQFLDMLHHSQQEETECESSSTIESLEQHVSKEDDDCPIISEPDSMTNLETNEESSCFIQEISSTPSTVYPLDECVKVQEEVSDFMELGQLVFHEFVKTLGAQNCTVEFQLDGENSLSSTLPTNFQEILNKEDSTTNTVKTIPTSMKGHRLRKNQQSIQNKTKSISKLQQLLIKTRNAPAALGFLIKKKARMKGCNYRKYCTIPIKSLSMCWRGHSRKNSCTICNRNTKISWCSQPSNAQCCTSHDVETISGNELTDNINSKSKK